MLKLVLCGGISYKQIENGIHIFDSDFPRLGSLFQYR